VILRPESIWAAALSPQARTLLRPRFCTLDSPLAQRRELGRPCWFRGPLPPSACRTLFSGRHRASGLERRCNSSAPTSGSRRQEGCQILVLSDRFQRRPLCAQGRPEPELTATTHLHFRRLRCGLERFHQHLARLGLRSARSPWWPTPAMLEHPPPGLPDRASAPAPSAPGFTWEKPPATGSPSQDPVADGARQAATPRCRRRPGQRAPGPGGRLAQDPLQRSGTRCWPAITAPRYFEAIAHRRPI